MGFEPSEYDFKACALFHYDLPSPKNVIWAVFKETAALLREKPYVHHSPRSEELFYRRER